MKKIICIAFIWFGIANVKAQTAITDSLINGKVTVIKDSRLDELVKNEAAFNDALATALRASKGYRLMVLSTNDRPLAMKIRAQLLQHYPDQKVYMSYQPPYIKLKLGNFLTKEDADTFRKELVKSKLISNNIYLLPETIEVKPEKPKDNAGVTN